MKQLILSSLHLCFSLDVYHSQSSEQFLPNNFGVFILVSLPPRTNKETDDPLKVILDQLVVLQTQMTTQDDHQQQIQTDMDSRYDNLTSTSPPSKPRLPLCLPHYLLHMLHLYLFLLCPQPPKTLPTTQPVIPATTPSTSFGFSMNFLIPTTRPTLSFPFGFFPLPSLSFKSPQPSSSNSNSNPCPLFFHQITYVIVLTTTLATYMFVPTLTSPNFTSMSPTTTTFSFLNHSPVRPPKLHLAIFDGFDPLGWLFQVNQYFSLYHIPLCQRLHMVSFYMKGDNFSWFKWMHQNSYFFDWGSFTRAMKIRFGSSFYENHQAKLFKLH